MSDYVELTPNGLLAYQWNSDTRDYECVPVADERAIAKLRCECRIKGGTTLGDIFRLVESLPSLKEFIRQYSWCWPIDELHAQGAEPMRSDDDEPLARLEVYVHTEAWDFEGRKDFSCYCGFHGIGREHEGGNNTYSVSCTPMYDLVDLPVVLAEKVQLYTPLGKDERPAITFEGDYCFSLLDVLDAIYDDISFYGGPAEARELIEEITEMKRQVDAGEAETIPLDDLLNEESEDA